MVNLHTIDTCRLRGQAAVKLFGWEGDETCGAFILKSSIDAQPLIVIASSNLGWDHVSVSRRNRCPNWTEMEQVKHTFFHPDETAVQYHVPLSNHINNHPHCLHLWRPQLVELPMPPNIFV